MHAKSVPLLHNRADYFQCTKCCVSSRFSKLPTLFTVKLAFPLPVMLLYSQLRYKNIAIKNRLMQQTKPQLSDR